jgi:hypothetical protein
VLIVDHLPQLGPDRVLTLPAHPSEHSDHFRPAPPGGRHG